MNLLPLNLDENVSRHKSRGIILKKRVILGIMALECRLKRCNELNAEQSLSNRDTVKIIIDDCIDDKEFQ